MPSGPVVILVGGPNTGKTRFYTEFTNSSFYSPTTKSTPNFTVVGEPTIVLVDTPGSANNRNNFEYSWEGIFKLADIILSFGDWSAAEICGDKMGHNPKFMTWSGDNEETMKRIREYLQGSK